MKWLKDLWHELCNPYEKTLQSVMSSPTKPAPPMPTIKPPKIDISEPVVTLLAMLERDEWEPTSKSDYSSHEITNTLTNIYNESLHLSRSISMMSGRATNNKFKVFDWMTEDEFKIVSDIFSKRLKEVSDLNKSSRDELKRAAFAKQLGVTL